MSEQNHPWCRDVSRDEAIRLAEDIEAAARVPLPDHRDLPQAVAELRERVARLEAVIPKSVSVSNAEAHENKGGTMPADGLRTERVTLEITHDIQSRAVELATWVRSAVCWKLRAGESVRVIEDRAGTDMGNGVFVASTEEVLAMCRETEDRLTAERDAAKEECERLRAILPPESERGQGVGEGSWAVFACKAVAERDEARADLATMRGKCDGLKDRVAELEAECAPGLRSLANNLRDKLRCCEGALDRVEGERRAAREECERLRHLLKTKESECETHHPWVHPTEAAHAANAGGEQPQPPRGWLTPEERACIEELLPYTFSGVQAKTLTMLLAREAPPRGWVHLSEDDCAALYLARAVLDGVFVGSWQEKFNASKRLGDIRDRAIRAAGGEVQ